MGYLFNGIGIIGVSIILTAFFLNQHGKLASNSTRYLIMNLSGSIMIIISLVYSWNLPSFVINSIWCIISVYGLMKNSSLTSLKISKNKKPAKKNKNNRG